MEKKKKWNEQHEKGSCSKCRRTYSINRLLRNKEGEAICENCWEGEE